jgi:hypothetical protein
MTAIAHSTHGFSPAPPRPCGHARHVGTCAACQRTQLARWHAQLTQAETSRPLTRSQGPR